VRQAGINGSPFLYTSVNSCLYADSHLLWFDYNLYTGSKFMLKEEDDFG
jgi:hypothetical protein